MKHGLFLSRAITVVLTLLLMASCGAPQRSLSSIPASPTIISIQSIPTSTILPNPAIPSPSEPAPTQQVTVAPEVSTWLRENAIPFDTTDPDSDFEDLMPLKELIGDARIVALGEATHGTHEFFEMKHRILRFLVEEMGFNTFAIEANWPEANLVNDYVQTGQGDPAELLKGLYYWTWNTQEALDMILWMRAHNGNPGDAPLVSFYGFDMKYHEVAIENVIAYLEKVDPASAAKTAQLYGCFRRYTTGQLESMIYAQKPAQTKTACRANLQTVYDQLRGPQFAYAAQSSPEAFARVLQNANLVLQAEHTYGAGEDGITLRDSYMAENVVWLLDQAGPDAKIVLWAHNAHVRTDKTIWKPMGAHLRELYGNQMVVFGFSFYQGSFNANYTQSDSEVLSIGLPPEDSHEYYFNSAKLPRFFLDVRGVPTDSPAANWLLTSHLLRGIGSMYDPSHPGKYFSSISLPDTFDVIIHFQDTSPSLLLNR